MPRLPPSLIHRAARLSPHLAALLPTCRTLTSAQMELTWLREHVRTSTHQNQTTTTTATTASHHLARLVTRRAAGVPLQYVLGSQPFLNLDILCTPGVLIPRPETEAWTAMLADLVFACSEKLRVVDLCSGTGCIGLSLFAHDLKRGVGLSGAPSARVFGFDVEPRAVKVARRNVLRNFRDAEVGVGEVMKAVQFRRADIFQDEWMDVLDDDGSTNGNDGEDGKKRIDVLVSNPPYISQHGFDVDTGRNVRNYEPKLALVPMRAEDALAASCAPEDVFYARLLDIAGRLRPRFAAFEVGDMEQAIRVVEMVMKRLGVEGQVTPPWEVIEIWRDWPDCLPVGTEEDSVLVSGRQVPVRGSGHGRVVFLAERHMERNRFVNQGFLRDFYTE